MGPGDPAWGNLWRGLARNYRWLCLIFSLLYAPGPIYVDHRFCASPGQLYGFLSLGLFPFICIVALIPFLPGAVWDHLRWAKLSGTPEYAHASTPPSTAAWINFVPAILFLSLASRTFGATGIGMRGIPWGRTLCRIAGLEQSWNLYVPLPDVSAEFTPEGHLANGTQIRLSWRGVPLPNPKHAAIPNMRWRKYIYNVLLNQQSPASERQGLRKVSLSALERQSFGRHEAVIGNRSGNG